VTPDEVSQRVIVISAHSDNPEQSHAEADALYRDVLQAIADGATNASLLASRALRVEELELTKWYA
jgi:hypothetical protein